MKHLLTSFLLLLSFVTFSQDELTKDHILSEYMAGDWTHVQSVYPSGNVIEYYQEFSLANDGSGICTLVHEGIKMRVSIQWKLMENTIYLYTVRQDGSIEHSDTIKLKHLDDERFFGEKIYGPEELRKTCYYKRKKPETV